jgi:hypothetical protein
MAALMQRSALKSAAASSISTRRARAVVCSAAQRAGGVWLPGSAPAPHLNGT